MVLYLTQLYLLVVAEGVLDPKSSCWLFSSSRGKSNTSSSDVGRSRGQKSGFRGVHANGKRWQAKLWYEGKRHHVGSFHTPEQAAAAYDEAARKHHGADAICNFASAEEASASVSAATSYLPPPGKCVGCNRVMGSVHALACHQRYCMAWHNLQGTQPTIGKSGFRGVSACKNKWRAVLHYEGKKYNLGLHRTPEEAAAAYDDAARKHSSAKSLQLQSPVATTTTAAVVVAAAAVAGLKRKRPGCIDGAI
jgi:hypothetical protein